MKTYEFNTKISSDGKIDCPEDIRKKLPPSQKVRIIILINDEIDALNEENLTDIYAKISESTLNKIWDNPEDADYDNL